MSAPESGFSYLTEDNYYLASENYPYNNSPSIQQFLSQPSSAASSVPNTDEEDDNDKKKQQKRREKHSQAEKKRRETLKQGYEALQQVLQPTVDASSTQKLSKAAVMQKTIEQIEMSQNVISNQKKEIDDLRKQKEALECMKENYSHLVTQHKHDWSVLNTHVSCHMKREIFKEIMDELFVKFDKKVSTGSFQELSGCIITWIENNCKPDEFNALVNAVMATYHDSQH